MKARHIVLFLTTLLAACSQPPPHHPNDANLVIAIQPLGEFSSHKITYISGEIGRVFHDSIGILPAAAMPATALDITKGIRYSADSLLRIFRPGAKDNRIMLLVTDDDIYTTVRDARGAIKKPAYKYRVWGIFGLGDCPGSVCIVSDCRLRTKDTAEYRHRLRTVVLHEIGHNFGLPHCPTPHCIMNDANERVATVDNSANDYCRACREKLGLP